MMRGAAIEEGASDTTGPLCAQIEQPTHQQSEISESEYLGWAAQERKAVANLFGALAGVASRFHAGCEHLTHIF